MTDGESGNSTSHSQPSPTTHSSIDPRPILIFIGTQKYIKIIPDYTTSTLCLYSSGGFF